MDIVEAQRVIAEYNALQKSPEQQAIHQATQQTIAFAQETNTALMKAAEDAQAAMRAMQGLNTERLIEKFKREGKITPAVESFARAIIETKPLATSTVDEKNIVKFANGDKEQSVHFAEAFVSFLEGLPPVISYSEMIRNQQLEENNLTTEQIELAKKMGANPESVVKYGNQ